MITIKGIFKGTEKRPYNFNNSKGEPVSGVVNNGFIEVANDKIAPDKRIKTVKLPSPEYNCVSKIGSACEWSIYITAAGKIVLVEELTAK